MAPIPPRRCRLALRCVKTLHCSLPLVALILWTALFAAPSRADEQKPSDPTITSLTFQVLDAKPDENSDPKSDNESLGDPVKSFRYTCAIYSLGTEDPLRKPETEYKSEDGILRIPEPFPPFGRIRIWIDADELDQGYRHGYAAFSYRIDPDKPSKPAVIQLKQGSVLTGKVLDAKTGRPIAGAEVAPLKWGHHFSWPDWDKSTKTNQQGEFRVVDTWLEGLAARHPAYRELKEEYGGIGPGHNQLRWASEEVNQEEIKRHGFVLRLHPLLKLHGRVVDPEGKPITGAKIYQFGPAKSDDQGRFVLSVTCQEWNDRWTMSKDYDPPERQQGFSIFASNYHLLDVPLADFSFDRETVITMTPEKIIHGQVLDENGQPLENCTIELKSESDCVLSDFYRVKKPYKEGKWKESISKYDIKFTLRVSVNGVVRSVKCYTLDEVSRGPIITRLSKGHKISGKLIAQTSLDEKNKPIAFLSSQGDEKLDQQMKIKDSGDFTVSGLSDGRYTLRLQPALSMLYRGGHMNGGVGGFSRFGSKSPNKPWETAITIKGRDVVLDPIDLNEANLMPGSIGGIIYHPNTNKPFANAFGYICLGTDDIDTVGGCYYLHKFMTDAEGRFENIACPPGKYVLFFTDDALGYGTGDPSVWINIASEEICGLKLFAPEPANQLAVNFIVGDGSPKEARAGTAIDAEATKNFAALQKKHTDPKTGEVPYFDVPNSMTLRISPQTIRAELEPLDETVKLRPINIKPFEFSPENLHKNESRDLVIPNVSSGRWRLTLTAGSEKPPLLTREIEFTEAMPPIEVNLPPAALAGSFDDYYWYATVTAIPNDSYLPTRSMRTERYFRFIALAPATYTLVIQAEQCEPKRLENVLVEQGKTTWLDDIKLKRIEPKTQPSAENSQAAPHQQRFQPRPLRRLLRRISPRH